MYWLSTENMGKGKTGGYFRPYWYVQSLEFPIICYAVMAKILGFL